MPNAFHYPPVDEKTLRWGCYLTSIGCVSYSRAKAYPCQGHPPEFGFNWEQGRVLADSALVLVLKGGGEWESPAGVRASLSAGDILYLVPGGWHRYQPFNKSGWTEKWLCARGVFLHDAVQSGIIPDHCVHLRGGLRPAVEQQLDRLRKEVLLNKQANRASWGARAFSILLECLERADATALEESWPVQPDAIVQRALQFIHQTSHRPLGVKEVANHCAMERRTLERRFAHAGCGPINAHITRTRLHRALILLCETNLPIKEIAYACGFGGGQCMLYNFRQYYRVTPGSIRQMSPSQRNRFFGAV